MDNIPQKDIAKDMIQSNMNNHKNKPAFTIIEIVMAIVVMGILASLAMPRVDRDLKQNAANHILSSIRFTQHLAINDNMHEFNDPQWQRKYWRIVFSTCTGTDKYYMIGTDTDKDGSTNADFEKTEAAIDPLSGKPLFWTGGVDCSNGGDGTVSEEIFISKKYGITGVETSGGCADATHIAFDHMGRPHHGEDFANSNRADYAGYMKDTCTFTFTMSDGDEFAIKILPETGYAYIEEQDAS